VVLDFKKGCYFGLSQVAARTWALLGEPKRVTDIRARLLKEFDVDPEVCERDLLALLEDLRARDLIEVVA
jgi:coenzyme PQQ synthesis protein D (PqqD)